jgi:hypothetical protein
LLRAASRERPDAGAEERVARALGLVGVSIPPSADRIAPKNTVAMATRWIIGGALGVVLAVGAYRVFVHGPATSSPPIAQPPAPPAIVQPPAVAASSETPAVAQAASADAVPIASSTPSAAAPAHAPNPSSTSSARPSLEAEIEALGAARRALDSGDAAGTLARLDRYAHDFPRGALSQEATVLRIEALSRAGRTAEARALGKRFLAQNPQSPHASRIRSLLGDTAAP